MMQFKIIAAPGDHRDDFEAAEKQLNEWSASANPRIVSVHVQVTTMIDTKNAGRYLMTIVVAYNPGGG